MVAEVLIAGAGQLGSRYLQGLSRCTKPLRIWVYDISAASLDRAKQRWLECERQPHAVEYIQDLGRVPTALEVAIVATNADARRKTVEDVSRVASVRYWILEKVLAQKVTDLHAIARLTSGAAGAWVNTPMHLWPLYRAIRQQSAANGPIRGYVGRYPGLACNAIHYIDLVSRWNSESVSNIETSRLGRQWIASKRPGFYEVEGELTVTFSGGSTLVLAGSELAKDYEVRIETGSETWKADEVKGHAVSETGKSVDAPLPRQSELAGPLVEEILTRGKCGLPSVQESIEQHEPLLRALMTHWNSNMPSPRDHAPIT
jgi:hypothetical protein